VGSLVGWLLLVSVFSYSPGQDHFGAITLPSGSQWYANYVISETEIQDTDILFHNIGRSIENVRRADIVFLGSSRVLFGIDGQTFDAFAQRYGIKMFNLAFAGVKSGEFSRLLIHKWDIHPPIWVIDLYAGPPDNFSSSFFNLSRMGLFETYSIGEWGKFEAYANVGIRNLRWRVKMAFGLEQPSSYRSSETGNWYLDRWPNRLRTDMPKMANAESPCAAESKEIEAASKFIHEIGGDVVVTQVPSKFSCYKRAQEIASALGVPLFAPDPSEFSTTDGGGHLDEISSTKYSKDFFAWLEQIPTFRRLRTTAGRHLN
jgi:hypothetical protein